MFEPIPLLRRWIDVPSPTGDEGAFAARVVADLRALGVPARAVEAAPGRPNVVAGAEPAQVVLCTHLDVVAPHVPSSEDATAVWGRGACDAKGCMVAMVAAWLALDAGERGRVGLLFVAGEEGDHCGARAAWDLPWRPASVVLGEPCGLTVARAQMGMLKVRVVAEGVAAHSACPERGVSAIHRLLDALGRLRAMPLPSRPDLGASTMHVGLIAGGVGANVIAPSAEATAMFRQTVPAAELAAAVAQAVEAEGVRVEVLGGSDPIRFERAGQGETAVVPFNTDAATLEGWAPRVLLAGPGELVVAHSAEERIDKAALHAGARQYVELVRHELALPHA